MERKLSKIWQLLQTIFFIDIMDGINEGQTPGGTPQNMADQ